jgi:hypothetical protein
MSDERQMDARLEVLARYRDLGPGERLFLWLSYPGLRDSFAAIDRATGGSGDDRLRSDSDAARRSGRSRCRPCRTGVSGKGRPDSRPASAAAGCGGRR